MPFCGTCGSQIASDAKFCPACGRALSAAPAAPEHPPVSRPRRPLSRGAKIALATSAACLAALATVSFWAFRPDAEQTTPGKTGPSALEELARASGAGRVYLVDTKHPLPNVTVKVFEGQKEFHTMWTNSAGYFSFSTLADVEKWKFCLMPSSGLPGKGFCEDVPLVRKWGSRAGHDLVLEATHDFFVGKNGENLTAEYEKEVSSRPMEGPASKPAERVEREKRDLRDYYGSLAQDRDIAWNVSYWQTGRAGKRDLFFGAWYEGLRNVTVDSVELSHPSDARMNAYRVSGTLHYGKRDEPFTTVKVAVLAPGGDVPSCFVTCGADLEACYKIRTCEESYSSPGAPSIAF